MDRFIVFATLLFMVTSSLASWSYDPPPPPPPPAPADCPAADQLACNVKNNGKLELLANNGILNSLGNNDGADPKSNMVDMCDGNKAKRSSYTCSSGTTPGGTVCVTSAILNYLQHIAQESEQNVQVNAIAGACHSTTSKHYLGRAVDLQIKPSTPQADWQMWMSACRDRGGVAYGPGDRGHSTHVHCQI